MTYNRMEAKAIAGEHCRFCGRERVPLVKTRCCERVCFFRNDASNPGFPVP